MNRMKKKKCRYQHIVKIKNKNLRYIKWDFIKIYLYQKKKKIYIYIYIISNINRI